MATAHIWPKHVADVYNTYKNTVQLLRGEICVCTNTTEYTFFNFYFYRCTVHLEDSLTITPTNAPVYHLLI